MFQHLADVILTVTFGGRSSILECIYLPVMLTIVMLSLEV